MLRGVVGVVALGLLLSGCGQVNHSVSQLMADGVPQWAGGLPDGLPPRPGERGYDEFYHAQMQRSLTATAQAWPQHDIAGGNTTVAAAPGAVPARAAASTAPAQSIARNTAARRRPVQSASAEAIY